MDKVSLYYNDLATGGTSDKEYHLQVAKSDDGFVVNYQFGRRGGTLCSKTLTPEPLPLADALAVYQKKLNEQLCQGYLPPKGEAKAAPIAPVQNKTKTPFMPELLEEIEEQHINFYLDSPRHWLEVKADGHRRQVQKFHEGNYAGYNKKGEAVALPAPLVKDLERLNAMSFFLDGEQIADDLIVYDLLELDGQNLAKLPYQERCEQRAKLLSTEKRRAHISIVSTWKTPREKKIGFKILKRCRAEGAVLKLIDAPYMVGRSGQQKKFKFIKSCTCKVIRVGDKGHHSATLALLDAGKWREVGRASLIGKDHRIQPGSLVEVNFLYFTGNRLYQPRVIAFRDDQSEADCTFTQLKTALKGGLHDGQAALS